MNKYLCEGCPIEECRVEVDGMCKYCNDIDEWLQEHDAEVRRKVLEEFAQYYADYDECIKEGKLCPDEDLPCIKCVLLKFLDKMKEKPMADKKAYIVFNHDNCYSTAIKLTEEQVKAVEWFIDFADLDFSVCLPEEVASEVE